MFPKKLPYPSLSSRRSRVNNLKLTKALSQQAQCLLQIARAIEALPTDAQGNATMSKRSRKNIIDGLLGSALVTDELSVVVDAQIQYPSLERQRS